MQAKITRLLVILILSSIGVSGYSQSAKVVAYFPSYRFQFLDQIDFCKITHLNLAFANPDSDGNLEMPAIAEVVAHAREDNPEIKIYIALAGGALSSVQASNWSNLIDIPANRPAFILKILDYVEVNELDGVDMDLEWNHVTSGYDNFALELGAALKSNGFDITAALPATYRYPEVTDEVVDMYDWINLMAYDLTGSWDPDNEGPHSPYFFARAGIDYWKAFGISGDKLTLGVPFYGVEFGNGGVSAFTYRYMVEMDTAFAYIDEVGSAYYNGIHTIKEKVILASEEVSGTMIWEIGQDHFSTFSLLKAIDEQYEALGITTTSSTCGIVKTSDEISSSNIQIFPNPIHDYFKVTSENEISSVEIWDIRGNLIQSKLNINSKYIELSTHNWTPSMYVIRVHTKDDVLVDQIIKN